MVGDRAQSVCRPARERVGLGGEERELQFVADGCGDASRAEPLDGASEHAAGACGVDLPVERVDGDRPPADTVAEVSGGGVVDAEPHVADG